MLTESTTDTYCSAALGAVVEIIIDRWGVPHIYAQNEDDLFFAQGFNAARERLYQIDLWFRRGNGRLSEVLGPDYVAQDRANRLLRYRGALDAEWTAYGVDTQRVVTNFLNGYNAYVDWLLEHPESVPPEFTVNGYLPAKWDPEDLVRFRTHGILFNAGYELARAMTIEKLGLAAERIARVREPDDPLRIPEGLELAALSDDVLNTYHLAFAPVEFEAARRAGANQDSPDPLSGSNNWVVGPERTSTGRPILANDPHRAVTLPALRYLAHLNAPGIDVIGAGEPGLPGITIGHNQKVGFGLTIWPADVEDLYVYELNPQDPDSYRYDGKWERFIEVKESLPVQQSDSVEITLKYTRHGAVIFHDEQRGIAVALRAAWLEPGMVPYLGSLRYMGVENAEEFIEALRHWGTPAVNQVFADVHGDWGWQTSAKIPSRPNWDGGLPVPGDGRYEWEGLVGAEKLPGLRRPAEGWIATANEMNLPHSYDNQQLTTTYDWFPDSRQRRLREWLSQDERVTVEKSYAMQLDFTNVPGKRVLLSLASLPVEDMTHGSELRRLLEWDGVESTESREALVFEVWWRRHFRPWLIARYLRGIGVAEDALADALKRIVKDESFGGDFRGDLRVLESTDWTDSVVLQEVAAGVDATLSSALDELVGLAGEDSASWTWGQVHHSLFINTALDGTDTPSEWQRLGPVERGGGPDTPGLGTHDANFRQVVGSSFRMVLDVGDWDASLVVNGPGQSGDPRSKHYSDHFSAWAEGRSFPLAYSRAAVEAAEESRILLTPAENTTV